MSIKNWPGGVISDVPPTPSGPYQDSAASGVWTLEQQAYWEAQGLWPTAGVVNPEVFIETIFQTWLYRGNGSTQTVTNNVNLAGDGGMVWLKSRSAGNDNALFDTNRGPTKWVQSNGTDVETTTATSLTSFNANGFSLGDHFRFNNNGANYVSRTFRQKQKFFDVVTYSYQGNGPGTTAQIPHNLGSAPGMIMIKAVDKVESFIVWHRTAAGYFKMDSSQGADPLFTGTGAFGSLNPAMTDTYFTVGYDGGTNFPGYNYVAYIFAHDSGGFGVSGTENVITCGSYVGNGSTTGPVITLGYEPQWIMAKKSTGTGDWVMVDNMRGIVTDGVDPRLWANLASAENTGDFLYKLNATGFQPESLSDSINASGQTYVYIAIRRGPMAVPTTGTSVFTPIQWSGSDSQTLTPGFATDLVIQNTSVGSGPSGFYWGTRLQGGTKFFTSTSSGAEGTFNSWQFDLATGTFTQSLTTGTLSNSIDYFLRRAPSFHDTVCYNGSGTTTTQTHNLQAVPEFIFVKRRSGAADWFVYSAALGRDSYAFLNGVTQFQSDPGNSWGTTNPTTTTFSLSPITETNASGSTYIAHLFATCPGVSKVGSFTGTGATQVINCGFTGGARFVMVKATSTTGNWLVWDSARGIVAGNDPYLALNSGAAEVTNTDWVDTAATGFELSNAGGNLANTNGVSYIFLAIA
jgi:hypothetical protein